MVEPMEKDTLVFKAMILCPECNGGDTTLFASRKEETARIECDNCGIVERGIIPYGAGLEVGL